MLAQEQLLELLLLQLLVQVPQHLLLQPLLLLLLLLQDPKQCSNELMVSPADLNFRANHMPTCWQGCICRALRCAMCCEKRHQYSQRCKACMHNPQVVVSDPSEACLLEREACTMQFPILEHMSRTRYTTGTKQLSCFVPVALFQL